jgi:octaprenyl-diphosphate synthase
LLGARCLGYTGAEHIKLAAIIEFLHTATLLHDDVVDRSDLRRGRATANQLWGNAPSVLVGDFLYSRAFQLMVELKRLDIIAILSDATNVIAEGEVQQLANVGNADLTEANYYGVISAKTAMLFQAASHTAAVLSSCDETQIQTLRDYGLTLGLAYQLVDDWLDYAGDPAVMGKNAGDDLAEGKITLPLIYTLRHGGAADRKVVRDAIETRSNASLKEVVAAVQRCGALDRTRRDAEAQAERAINLLTPLPDNAHRRALVDLARFCVARLN